mmetsp:Transcript_21009/g.31096  ORF Transcript_21009/g.31096 Transcript_21009/m.31096 type:complete len:128 (-) Transcript_21009:425-808(-)
MSNREHKIDAFLSSMSFAKNMADCDCDECGFICEVPPPPIQDAVNEHKKRKLLEVSPSQERSLISRDGGISMWKFTMPPGSQPLTEYGNSHRFIFIKNLPKVSDAFSIYKAFNLQYSQQQNFARAAL